MNRRIWATEEKLSVAIAILKGDIPITEICYHYQVSATQAYRWRDQFLEGGKKELSDGHTNKDRRNWGQILTLYKVIDRD